MSAYPCLLRPFPPAAIAALALALTFIAPPVRGAPPEHPASRAAARRGADYVREGRERGPQRLTRGQLTERARGPLEAAAKSGGAGYELLGVGPGNIDWEFIGPSHMTGEFWSGGADVAGRVSCVAPDPIDPNTAYVAAAMGGVWRTTDRGATWTPLTDGLPSEASGWVAVDPADTQTLWYATGEQHYSGDSWYGAGVFRSINGGASWTQRGTAAQTGSYIARLVLQPGSSTTLYVASDLGFVRTTDGGSTWTVTLATGWCNDIAVDPTDPAVVYCSVDGAGVYKSSDAGASWTALGPAYGLPGTGFERVNLAIAPSAPWELYAGFAAPNGMLLGLYKTTNSGANWFPLVGTPDYLGGQGWYDHTLVVDPVNANNVFAGGLYPYTPSQFGVIWSSNGGVTWTDITTTPSGIVHPDQHALAFGPDGTLWLGNDGGVWRTTNFGTDWVNCNAGLSVAQFYTIATDPLTLDHALGGTQDNGTAEWSGTPDWSVLISGDGGPSLIPMWPMGRAYTTREQMKSLIRWNSGVYDGTIVGPWYGVDPADWANGPLVQDWANGDGVLLGTNRIWRTDDGGSSWTAISGDLSNAGGVLRSIATPFLNGAPLPPYFSRLIYASSSDGALSVTHDGGATWTRCDPPAGGFPIPDIVAHSWDSSTVYVCVERSTGGRVYHTTDGGLTWTNLTGNLPSGRYALCLDVDFRDFFGGYGPPPTPHLYVGTDDGVYVSHDSGAHWTRASNGMPRGVAVYDLRAEGLEAFLPHTDRLLAATHGRGVYRAALDHETPNATLSYPDGTEDLPYGATLTVAWQGTDASPPVSSTVALSRDGGFTYPELLTSGVIGGPTFSHTFNWTVTGPATDSARVIVPVTDALGQTYSIISPMFRIHDPLADATDERPIAFAIAPPSPNPARVPLRLEYAVPHAAEVEIVVFGVDGRVVRRLASGAHPPGRHSRVWDGRDESGAPVGAGIYFARLAAPGYRATRRLALLK